MSEDVAAVLAAALRRCRVEDAPNPLIRESDIGHVVHMVAAALREAGYVHRDEADRLRATVARVEAVLRLIAPDHITPVGVRQVRAALGGETP